MSRPWINKQKLEQTQDSRISNFLVNKSTDFSILKDDDKQQTFHVIDILIFCFIYSSLKVCSGANIIKEPVNFKLIVAANGILQRVQIMGQ